MEAEDDKYLNTQMGATQKVFWRSSEPTEVDSYDPKSHTPSKINKSPAELSETKEEAKKEDKVSTPPRTLRKSTSGIRIRSNRSGSAKRQAPTATGAKPPMAKAGVKPSPVKASITTSYDMSKEEMFQIIDSQKKEIRYLHEKVKYLETQNNSMVDNFKLSSEVLLERLKDLEGYKAQVQKLQTLQGVDLGSTTNMAKMMGTMERPQTAQVLSKIGPSGQYPSTADSSANPYAQETLYNSSRGFGELGATKRLKASESRMMTQSQLDLNDQRDDLSSDDDFDNQLANAASGKEVLNAEIEKITCPNCGKVMTVKEAPAHTVQCYRNSTKCRICGEVILKTKKKEHLARWRDPEQLLKAIQDDHEEQISNHFDHGMDCNMQFANKDKNLDMRKSTKSLPVPDATNQHRENWTPMHYAAEHGSLNVILAMVSRGAGIDPTDVYERTPLMIAIENNKSAVARSLIELGADIETSDVYGKTPVMYACKVASVEIVELLIKCKADVKVVNKVGDSAVTMAQKSGNQDIMMLLVKSGASIRPSSRSRPIVKKV